MLCKGVATGANKKFNLKICPDKQTEYWGQSQSGDGLAIDSMEECGKIDIEIETIDKRY